MGILSTMLKKLFGELGDFFQWYIQQGLEEGLLENVLGGWGEIPLVNFTLLIIGQNFF